MVLLDSSKRRYSGKNISTPFIGSFFSFVWWCQESIDDTFALAPQILNGLQIESNYTCNINLLIPDFLSLSMGEATSFPNECLCHVPQIINIKLCLQPFIQIHFFLNIKAYPSSKWFKFYFDIYLNLRSEQTFIEPVNVKSKILRSR